LPWGSDKLSVGLVGLGYWGSNVARNLSRLPEAELIWCCDTDPSRRSAVGAGTRFTSSLDTLLADESVDAVAIATPVVSHVAIAERVLEAGKHCFVEKPLAQSVEDAERLSRLAGASDLVLMVGHLLEYHPAITVLRTMIDAGELGEVFYLYSQRLNLGQLRADENALWSLGAHDVSLFLAMTGEVPTEVGARGESYLREGVEDVVFGFLRFPSGVIAHTHLSWLDPHKERRLTVVGSRRMAVVDDMVRERKLTVFDKGFDPGGEAAGEYVARQGEARSPAIREDEPLRVELDHFLDCVRTRARPRSDSQSGVRVVRVLDAMQRSLLAGGETVRLEQGKVL
jgi:predicted dehydrogenase